MNLATTAPSAHQLCRRPACLGLVSEPPKLHCLAQAGYLLREVLEAHPAMKVVITREVEKFLFRPGLQERARYYGVIFLNQMPLSHNPALGMRPSACPSLHALCFCCSNLSILWSLWVCSGVCRLVLKRYPL